VVLTAAHCVFTHMLRAAPQRIRISAGRLDRDGRPYGAVYSSRYFAPERYLASRFPNLEDRRNYDYGFILLPRPFPGIERFMTISSPSDAMLRRLRDGALFTIAGYPGDRPIGTLWRHTERLRQFTPRRLHYTMDTCPGHSGSPIWHRDRERGVRSIVGVHTSGVIDERGRPYGCSRGTVVAPPGLMNSGVRITTDIARQIREFRGGADAAAGMQALP
jgi:V8-like Glu-specific endopeptidase